MNQIFLMNVVNSLDHLFEPCLHSGMGTRFGSGILTEPFGQGEMAQLKRKTGFNFEYQFNIFWEDAIIEVYLHLNVDKDAVFVVVQL